MPNWATTTYTLTGKDAHKVFNLIHKHLEDNNDANKNWLGRVVEDLNNGECNVYARGWINDYDVEDDDCIKLHCETAWSECNEWREFLESKFEDLKIYYVTEECGMDVYITNDPDYPYMYLLDTDECSCEEYETEEEMLKAACSHIGKEEVGTREQVEEWCEKFNDKHKDCDKYVYIHEYTYIDD